MDDLLVYVCGFVQYPPDEKSSQECTHIHMIVANMHSAQCPYTHVCDARTHLRKSQYCKSDAEHYDYIIYDTTKTTTTTMTKISRERINMRHDRHVNNWRTSSLHLFCLVYLDLFYIYTYILGSMCSRIVFDSCVELQYTHWTLDSCRIQYCVCC